MRGGEGVFVLQGGGRLQSGKRLLIFRNIRKRQRDREKKTVFLKGALESRDLVG